MSNFIFAGFMLCVDMIFKKNTVIYQNGVVYFDISALKLITYAITCYLILGLFVFLFKRTVPENNILDITIYKNDKSISVKALLDTGNTLKEPFSNFPAIVCEYRYIKDICPDFIIDLGGMASFNILQYDSSLRFVNFKSVGGEGILPCLKPDLVAAKANNKNYKSKDVYIAVYKGSLSNGEYNALIGSSFFDVSQ